MIRGSRKSFFTSIHLIISILATCRNASALLRVPQHRDSRGAFGGTSQGYKNVGTPQTAGLTAQGGYRKGPLCSEQEGAPDGCDFLSRSQSAVRYDLPTRHRVVHPSEAGFGSGRTVTAVLICTMRTPWQRGVLFTVETAANNTDRACIVRARFFLGVRPG